MNSVGTMSEGFAITVGAHRATYAFLNLVNHIIYMYVAISSPPSFSCKHVYIRVQQSAVWYVAKGKVTNLKGFD